MHVFQCISPRRDLAVGRVPFPVKSGMAPTVGSTVGPVMNANGVVPGPQNLLNQFSNNMISELPANSAQREILNSMLQAQNFNSSTLDAQQLAHIHALQQQSFYAQQQATLASQNRINQNGAISPPKVQPPMSIQNQIGLRQKRPSQAETFPHEPMNKRAVGSSFPQGGNFPLQQLSSMTNSQQMAILQQMQQQNLPTSASMQMPAVGPRPPQTRLPFPAQGFPSFNPTGAVLSQGDEGLQNYIRNMQMSGMIPQRPQADLSQLMAMMAAGNQPRTSMSFDDLKRKEILPQIPGLDQNSLAQQLALRSAEEIRLIQLRNSPQQMAFAAMAQQNDQRRRSLPLVQPNPLGLPLLNPQFQTQSSLLTTTASENTSQASGTQVSSPVKEIQSTPSVSSASPNQTSNGNKNGIESHSPSHLGPDEMRYQMFLHSINLFNKKVIEENDGAILSERLEIPPPVVEAARYTHLAKIQVPNPSVSLDEIQPGWRGKLEGSSKIAQTEIPSTTT